MKVDELADERATKPRKRLAPEERKEMILAAAISFFAENGFDARLRDLGKHLGIAPSLIVRYFETKEGLIDAVYEAVYDARWQPEWETNLKNRRVPLKERLVDFYTSYLERVDDRDWTRISLLSSLQGHGLANRYYAQHMERLLKVIALEIRHHEGGRSKTVPTEVEMERAWELQSAVFYYLVRKHVHDRPVLEDRGRFVELIVGDFLKSEQRTGI